MINIGIYNLMKVVRISGHGYYIDAGAGKAGDDVLLPKNSTAGQTLSLGEEVSAFIYRDSEDRIIATLRKPKAVVGDIALLKVVSVTKIGAFVDIGIERDVLVPLKEQSYKLVVGGEYIFYIYVDKTGRLAATTYIEKHLENASQYRVGDEVIGMCYGFQTNGSVMVAVDNRYRGIILKNEYFYPIKPGEKLSLRIKKFYEDDKMALTPRKAPMDERLEMQDNILKYLREHDGFMPYNDKSSPEIIKEVFHQSKKYFKNALGGLMKQNLITQDDHGTYLTEV
jgi:Uncharacterized protein conserved in bacteria